MIVSGDTRTCPRCEKPEARKLDEASRIAFVDYYQCGSCHHVWTADRGTRKILRHVTPLRPSDDGIVQLRSNGQFRTGDFGVVGPRGVQPVETPEGFDADWVVQAVAPSSPMTQGRFRDVHGPRVPRAEV